METKEQFAKDFGTWVIEYALNSLTGGVDTRLPDIDTLMIMFKSGNNK